MRNGHGVISAPETWSWQFFSKITALITSLVQSAKLTPHMWPFMGSQVFWSANTAAYISLLHGPPTWSTTIRVRVNSTKLLQVTLTNCFFLSCWFIWASQLHRKKSRQSRMPLILRLCARTWIKKHAINANLPRSYHFLQQQEGYLHLFHTSKLFQLFHSAPRMDIPLLPLCAGNQIPMVSSM